MDYAQRLENMIAKEMTIGDTIVADNVYTEFKKGVSIDDLVIKYGMPRDKIQELIMQFGDNVDEN